MGEIMKESELTRTTLAIEQDLLDKFDRWMAAHGYSNRSQAIRDLIRTTLTEDSWRTDSSKLIAVLSLIYDHEGRSLSQELTHIQHEDHGVVLCSQHVHLDKHLCLEAIIMSGTAGQLRRLADTLIATRGVRAGKLTILSQDI